MGRFGSAFAMAVAPTSPISLPPRLRAPRQSEDAAQRGKAEAGAHLSSSSLGTFGSACAMAAAPASPMLLERRLRAPRGSEDVVQPGKAKAVAHFRCSSLGMFGSARRANSTAHLSPRPLLVSCKFRISNGLASSLSMISS